MPPTSDLNRESDPRHLSEVTSEPHAPSGRVARSLAIIALALGVAGLFWIRMSNRSNGAAGKPLPVVARVPSFSLTERSGKTVTNEDLLGTVWVADFVFTTCAGPCPELTLRMRSLQKDIARFGGKAKVVSFTIDPNYDQPPVLRAYANHYQADPDLWWFLTGNDEAAMHQLVTAGFLQALSPGQGGTAIIHSTQFVLLDKQGRIRMKHVGAIDDYTWTNTIEPLVKQLEAEQ